jgi:hypothetical protein
MQKSSRDPRPAFLSVCTRSKGSLKPARGMGWRHALKYNAASGGAFWGAGFCRRVAGAAKPRMAPTWRQHARHVRQVQGLTGTSGGGVEHAAGWEGQRGAGLRKAAGRLKHAVVVMTGSEKLCWLPRHCGGVRPSRGVPCIWQRRLDCGHSAAGLRRLGGVGDQVLGAMGLAGIKLLKSAELGSSPARDCMVQPLPS